MGIITQGKITQTITDLNTFTSQNGLPTVSTQTVNTNGTSTDTSGLGEWNLDSQDIVGAAGGQVGGIIFYNIPTLSNANLTADINKIVSDNTVKIINVSLGECETYTQQDGSAAADDQAFQQAVAQGQTFSVSSGDSGADECGDGGITPSYPASSPYVVAVGGTTLNASTTTWTSEVVWNDLSANEGATGGSPSLFESQPTLAVGRRLGQQARRAGHRLRCQPQFGRQGDRQRRHPADRRHLAGGADLLGHLVARARSQGKQRRLCRAADLPAAVGRFPRRDLGQQQR